MSTTLVNSKVNSNNNLDYTYQADSRKTSKVSQVATQKISESQKEMSFRFDQLLAFEAVSLDNPELDKVSAEELQKTLKKANQKLIVAEVRLNKSYHSDVTTVHIERLKIMMEVASLERALQRRSIPLQDISKLKDLAS